MKLNASSELTKYINSDLKPIIEPLIISLLTSRPTDIVILIQISSSLEYLKELQKNKSNEGKHKKSDSNNSKDDEKDYIDDSVLLKITKKGRCSISAEAYGEMNKITDFKPRIIKKSEDQKAQIKKLLLQSFLFSSLGYYEIEILVNAMEEVHFKPKDIVIKQGADGENLFIVEDGNLKCYRAINQNS